MRGAFVGLMFYFLTVPLFAMNFLGKAPTGKLELQDYHYPVSLFVPETYDPLKIYPFLMALPDVGEAPAEYLEEWAGIAKKKNFIVLVPSLQIRLTESPSQTDPWLFKLKREIAKQYRLDPNRIYLAGKNQGAHYAAYLGIRYPQEFSAIVLTGGSWSGPFEHLMQWKSSPLKQRPFLAVLDESDEALARDTERIAYKLTRKGYPVYMRKVKKEELSSPELKKELLEWSEEKQEAWGRQMAESRKSWKVKTSEWFQGFLEMKS